MKKRPEVENANFVTCIHSAAIWQSTKCPFEKIIVRNVLKNDSADVTTEEVIYELTNKFRIMEWRVQKLE